MTPLLTDMYLVFFRRDSVQLATGLRKPLVGHFFSFVVESTMMYKPKSYL